MRRTIGAVAGGIAVALLVIMVVEAIGNALYPPPPGLDLQDADAISRIPFRTLIFPVIAWFLGALAGGTVAVWVSQLGWTAWPVAAAVLVGTIVQFALMAHPLWMIIAGLVAPVIAALLAQRIAPRRTPGSQKAAD